MLEETLDANVELEPSTTQDANPESDSSTEEPQTEEATSQQASEKDLPFHEHPAWKSFQDRKDKEVQKERERSDRLEQQLLELTNKALTPQQKEEVEQKIYTAETPEEREFWQKVEQVAESRAKATEKRIRQEFEAKEKALLNQYGQMAAKQFLEEHPDIKKGSDELREIVKIASSRNLDLDEAYKIAMFDKNVQLAADKERKKQVQKKQEKLAANVETKSLPPTSLPPQSGKGEIQADDFLKTAQELGIEI